MVLDFEEKGDLMENLMQYGRFPEPIVRRIAL